MHRPSGIVSLALAAALLSFHVSTSLAAADIKSRFDLPEEPLDKALRDFAVQANCNISYEPSIVAGLEAPAIKGEYTPANVLFDIAGGDAAAGGECQRRHDSGSGGDRFLVSGDGTIIKK